MAIEIRAAGVEHAEQILQLIEELFKAPGRRPASYDGTRARDAIRLCIEGPESDVLLALNGERVVGLASVYTDVLSIRQGRRCWVEEMIVMSTHRGTGVGQRLLDAALVWGREHGCSHLELHSGLAREDAHRFYEKNGMTKVALVFYRDLETS